MQPICKDMKDTKQQFEHVIAICRDLFSKKLHDYGPAWRILRPASVTDQIFIKANRIRSIETKGVTLVDEGIRSEFIAIVNYGIIGLIQLELGYAESADMTNIAQFAAAGKETKSKSLAEIAMSYGYVYVAQVAMGANAAQTLKAIQEAEAYHGPSLIIGYAPCEMHSIKGGMQNCQKEMKKAVDCGYWNMFRFNPAAEKKFTLDSKAPAGGYQEFLMNEARYSRLTREFPERATVLFAKNEENAKERYEHLLKLVDMYDK